MLLSKWKVNDFYHGDLKTQPGATFHQGYAGIGAGESFWTITEEIETNFSFTEITYYLRPLEENNNKPINDNTEFTFEFEDVQTWIKGEETDL